MILKRHLLPPFSFLFVSFPREGTLHVSLLRTGYKQRKKFAPLFVSFDEGFFKGLPHGSFVCFPFLLRVLFQGKGHYKLRIGRDTLKICRILLLSLRSKSSWSFLLRKDKNSMLPPFSFLLMRVFLRVVALKKTLIKRNEKGGSID